MLNFNSVLLFSENPKKLVEFYTKVFDKKPDWTMEDYSGFQVGGCILGIMAHDQVHGANSDPNRLILNLETKEFKDEYERIKKVARMKKEAYKMEMDKMPSVEIATFIDPDGNLFQLMTPVN
jgi:predicted enzyme related to lactoylglutathione lyase